MNQKKPGTWFQYFSRSAFVPRLQGVW